MIELYRYLPDWSAQLHQLIVVMLQRIAFVVENHGHAVLCGVWLPFRNVGGVWVASLDEGEPVIAHDVGELIRAFGGARHLALEAHVVEHERKLHAVRCSQRVALGFPSEEVKVAWSSALCAFSFRLIHGT